MPIASLKQWNAETPNDSSAMKAFHQDGMEAHILETLLIPPALSRHIHCGDWSDIANTGEQVQPCPWSRFCKLANCTDTHPALQDYMAAAVMTGAAWDAAMATQRRKADENRDTAATDHPKYGKHIPVIQHTSPLVFVACGLGGTGKQRCGHATKVQRKQVIEVTSTMGHGGRKKVYGTTGRTPEVILHDSTLVHPSAIDTDSLLALAGLRNMHCAAVALLGIAGYTYDQANTALQDHRYSEPPEEYG